jgi:hypothetical protein
VRWAQQLGRLRRRAGHSSLAPTVRAALPLARGERILAHAVALGGEPVVATDRALLRSDGTGTGEPQWIRMPWHDIEAATWDDDAQALQLTVGSRPVVLRLDQPRLLPETVRERVTASIVVSQHVRLAGRRGVRVVARRVFGTDDVVWQLAFDSGVDPGDPLLRSAAERALQDVRAQTGL